MESNDNGLNLSSLPFDVIRKIIRVEGESMESMSLISESWNRLVTEHLNNRNQHIPLEHVVMVKDSATGLVHAGMCIRKKFASRLVAFLPDWKKVTQKDGTILFTHTFAIDVDLCAETAYEPQRLRQYEPQRLRKYFADDAKATTVSNDIEILTNNTTTEDEIKLEKIRLIRKTFDLLFLQCSEVQVLYLGGFTATNLKNFTKTLRNIPVAHLYLNFELLNEQKRNTILNILQHLNTTVCIIIARYCTRTNLREFLLQICKKLLIFELNQDRKGDRFFFGLPYSFWDRLSRQMLDNGLCSFYLGSFDKSALSLRREDCWATHARAHVLEMQGRTKESREFLEGTVQDWEPGWMLACHNHWHNALNYIEEGRYEEPLEMFDNEIGRRAFRSKGCLDLVDAASILWRLELEGVDVGKRWTDLPDLSSHLHDHFLSFNDAHYVFALHRGGKKEDAHELVRSLNGFVTSGPANNNRRVATEMGRALCEGMLAYAEGDYAKTVASIMPVRASIYRQGGSHAQNDVFTQTLVHACLKTGETEHKEFARTVLLERAQKKAHSGIAERLAKQLAENHL